MNKKLFSFVLVFFFVSYAWAEINVDETAKTLGAYLNFRKVSVPKEDQLKELKGIERNLDQELKKDPNNPRLWWLKGLNAWSFVHALQEPLTDKEKELKKNYQFELTNEAFKKALDLDRSNEPYLTLNMLYSLYKFGFLDVHIKAGRRIIEEDPNLEPRSELEIRGGMISHFIKLGRYDEAINILNEWAAKYPAQADRVAGYKKHAKRLIDMAKQAEKNQTATSEPSPSQAKEPEKPEHRKVAPEPTQTPQKQPKQVGEQKPQPLPAASKSPMVPSRVIIVFAALAVIFISIMFLMRRKR